MDGRKDRRRDGRPAGPSNGRTDGQNEQMEKLRNGTTDTVGYKVACMRLKMGFNPEKISKVHKLTYEKMSCELLNVVITF